MIESTALPPGFDYVNRCWICDHYRDYGQPNPGDEPHCNRFRVSFSETTPDAYDPDIMCCADFAPMKLRGEHDQP